MMPFLYQAANKLPATHYRPLPACQILCQFEFDSRDRSRREFPIHPIDGLLHHAHYLRTVQISDFDQWIISDLKDAPTLNVAAFNLNTRFDGARALGVDHVQKDSIAVPAGRDVQPVWRSFHRDGV